jgi:hypothetical protein
MYAEQKLTATFKWAEILVVFLEFLCLPFIVRKEVEFTPPRYFGA